MPYFLRVASTSIRVLRRIRFLACIAGVFLLIAIVSVPAVAQTFELVRDINTTTASSSNVSGLLRVGNITYFAADDGVHGRELWRTDGTAAGTHMVKDIYPGSYGSNPYYLTELNGKVYFAALSPAGGNGYGELWRSDGTEAGTVLVKDIHPGWRGSNPSYLTACGNALFFWADDGTFGTELWKSDGTEAGTVMVEDLKLFEASSIPSQYATAELTAANGLIFFYQVGWNTQPYEPYVDLWRSDGTAAGTYMLMRAGWGYGFLSKGLAFNDQYIFAAHDPNNGWEMWKTDGTNIHIVIELNPFSGDAFWGDAVVYNGSVLFSGNDGTVGSQLWKTDGTAAGTSLVKDVSPGLKGNVNLRSSKVINNVLYFQAKDEVAGWELWRTDGTPDGTYRVTDVAPGVVDSNAVPFAGANGWVLFGASAGGSNMWNLWRSDGTAGSFARVVPTDPGVYPMSGVVAYDDFILLAASTSNGSGFELWRSDASSTGTFKVKQVNALNSSSPNSLVSTGDALYFTADDGSHGYELWKTDGTSAGTVMVKDIIPGSEGSGPFWEAAIGNMILFSTWTPADGNSVWRTDGTEAGTTLVKESARTWSYSYPGPFVPLNGGAVFASGDSYNQIPGRIWWTDGTANGTTLLHDFPGSDRPYTLIPFQGAVFFDGEDTNGRQIWKTDGTPDGTVMLTDIVPGERDRVTRMYATDNYIFFDHYDASTGYELWKTDGTAAGTAMVKDIRPGIDSSNPNGFAFANGQLFFTADDGSGSGYELWKTDGTEAGTVMIKDIAPGEQSSYPQEFVTVNQSVFFLAQLNNESPRTLWKSDGTEEGTGPVGSGFYDIGNLRAFNGQLVFTATDAFGDELWVSDGTDPGTYRVSDLSPQGGSAPWELTEFGGNLYFSAMNESSGRELWMWRWNYPPTASGQTVTVPSGTVKSIQLQGHDPEEQPLAFAIMATPQHGTVTLLDAAAGTAQYTPEAGYLGEDSFTFYVSDVDKLRSEPATIVLDVTSGKLPPSANAGADQVVEATSPTGANVSLDGGASSDPEHGALTYQWNGAFGTATGATPHLALALGVHTITLKVTDPDGMSASDEVTITVRDTTAPLLQLPVANPLVDKLIADATSPAGATVTFVVSATDLVDTVPMVACVPESGHVFPMGITEVQCTATDASGNVASGSFKVLVKAAAEQISDLIDLVQSFNLKQGISNSLDTKLDNAVAALNAANSGDRSNVCNILTAFINETQSQRGKALTAEQADALIATAQRIRAVIGCSV